MSALGKWTNKTTITNIKRINLQNYTSGQRNEKEATYLYINIYDYVLNILFYLFF